MNYKPTVGVTLNIHSSEFIKELIKDNPDLEIAIKNAILDKTIKRSVTKELSNQAFQRKINELVKGVVYESRQNLLTDDVKKEIKKQVDFYIEKLVAEEISDKWDEEVLPKINSKIEDYKKKSDSLDIEKLVKYEIEKQVKERLGKLWK